MFTTSPQGVQYLNTLSDLSALTNPNNQNPVPFPPLSCWNPNNTATNVTLYQTCDGRMPANFRFPSQPMCVAVKSDRSPGFTAQMEIQWLTDAVKQKGETSDGNRLAWDEAITAAVIGSTLGWFTGLILIG